jgi:hypothetical protein
MTYRSKVGNAEIIQPGSRVVPALEATPPTKEPTHEERYRRTRSPRSTNTSTGSFPVAGAESAGGVHGSARFESVVGFAATNHGVSATKLPALAFIRFRA